MNRISERLQDAHMSRNTEAIASINSEILDKQAAKEDNGYKFSVLLNNEDSSAIKIYDFLQSKYPDWWEWEIETLERMLFLDYGVALEDVNRDKVLAVRHICRSDNAFSDWFEFNQMALSLSGSIADFEFLKSPSTGMIINCVKTLNYIRPERNSEFSIDVEKYMSIAIINEGIYMPPPSLAGIITEEFKKLVSKEMIELWPLIINKFKEFVTKPELLIAEEIPDIQAKRLIVAEAAAMQYQK